jgi:hypothetical protein
LTAEARIAAPGSEATEARNIAAGSLTGLEQADDVERRRALLGLVLRAS